MGSTLSVGTDQYTPDHVASEASQHKKGLPLYVEQ
jgi:hypothetical protein